jgi:small-conductance mechanosensitive channel
MEKFDSWREAITSSMQGLFDTVIGYLPNLLGALLVLIIGLLIAGGLGRLVRRLVELTKVDDLVDKLGVNKTFKAFGKVSVSGILSWLVKWFLIIVVLMAVSEILGLDQIIDFLNDVASYLPNVAIAIVIVLIGFVAGNFIYEVVHRAVKQAKMHSPKFLANLAKWGIIVTALLPAIKQLGIDTTQIDILFRAIVYGFAGATALAFGLGGRDHASKWLDAIKKKL